MKLTATAFVLAVLGGGCAAGSQPQTTPAVPATSRFLPLRPTLSDVGAPEGGLPVISDLAIFDGRLWLIESRVPLGVNGAAVWTYTPAAGFTRVFEDPFSQGFLRGDVIDGRLYVADGDPRGYAPGVVHIFETAASPPRTTIVEEAIHNFQVVKFGGALYVTGGLASGSWGLNRYDAAEQRWLIAQRGPHMRLRYVAVFDGALWGNLYADDGSELVKIDAALNAVDLSFVPGVGIGFDVEVKRNHLYVTGTSPAGTYAVRFEPGRSVPVRLEGLEAAIVFDFEEHDGVLYAVGCGATKSYLWASTDGVAFTRLIEWDDLRFGFAPGAGGSSNADGRASLASFQGKLYIGSSTNGRLYRMD
jgi:hypothetical protein